MSILRYEISNVNEGWPRSVAVEDQKRTRQSTSPQRLRDHMIKLRDDDKESLCY